MSENGDSRLLPEYLQAAIAEVEFEAEKDIDPQLIDIILDKHTQSLNYRRAAEYSEFLQKYFQIAIDLNNIRNFLRVKILNKDRDFLSKVLLDNGTLKTDLFLNQFEEDIENFAGAIKHTNYYKLVTEGIQSWTENHSLATLEKLSDNYLLNYIKQTKFAILGVEPLLGYLLAKEHEMKLMSEIAMIGDRDSILGFKALGVSIFPAETKDEVISILRTLIQHQFKIAFITEQVAPDAETIANEMSGKTMPVIMMIPSNKGSTGLGENASVGKKSRGRGYLGAEGLIFICFRLPKSSKLRKSIERKGSETDEKNERWDLGGILRRYSR